MCFTLYRQVTDGFVYRNIGYGSLNTMARVGAIVGPQLVFLVMY